MTTSFFEQLEPGMTWEIGSHTFEREEIIEFASQFDPQRFHLSEEGAKNSHFGKLCASGWQTGSIWMRLNVLNGREALLKATGYQGPMPTFGPSPGLRNIKWTLPVYVGDTVTYRSTITGKRHNPKRPGWGLVTNHSEGHNQDGKLVFSMDGAVIMRVD